MIPAAQSSPYALPPLRKMAWATGTMFSGRRQSVSRVPGAPPRVSTPGTAPALQRMTVHPVLPGGCCA